MSGPGRVRKELQECQKTEHISGVSASPRGESLENLIGVHRKDGIELFSFSELFYIGKLQGPVGTPYEGGVFIVDIQIPNTYPFDPPKMRFETKVWHPNISSQTGAICLDILKDQWSPALTIKTALLSLQALMSEAVPDDPQDAEVARMYLNDYNTFVSTAKFWTETYAKPHTDDADEQVLAKLIDMGFPEQTARKALEDANGDENAAVEALLCGM